MIEEKSQYQILKQYVLGNKNWSNTSLLAINLKNVILKELNFTQSCLVDVNFDSCNLEKANFYKSDLNNCNLSYSWLKDTNFAEANLVSINLKDTCLEKADFRQANLANANFSKAYLYCADLRGAYLKGANFSDAYLAGAMYDQYTIFDDSFEFSSTGMTYLPEGESQSESSDIIGNSLENLNNLSTRYYRGIKYEHSSKLKDNLQIVKSDSDAILLKYGEVLSNSLSYRGTHYAKKTEEKLLNVTEQITKKSSLKYRGQQCS